MLREKFENCFDFEEYEEMILSTDILITCSPQAVLDSLASGGRPIYVVREDYAQDFDALFESYNIPIVHNYDKSMLNETLANLNGGEYVKLISKSINIVKTLKEKLHLN